MGPFRSTRDIAAQLGGTDALAVAGGGSHDANVQSLHGPGPSPERIRILLLAANPLSTGRLAIEEEARAITEKLRLARDRDRFELITCLAVRPDDLLQYLNQYRPHVVHFSGHGSPAGELLLSAGDGIGRPVSAAAIGELFRIMRDDVRVVLLNACYTAIQARAINDHVDFVIGTRAPITDEAATVFAAAFYSALGFGRTVLQAFEQAKAAVMVHGLPGHDTPELLVRSGADLNPLYREGVEAPVGGDPMNPVPGPANQGGPAPVPPQMIASNGGVNVNGNVSGGITVTPTASATTAKKGLRFDTKLLLAALVFDVVFFFYGMWSYTGMNTPAETWRAAIMIVMVGVTVGMLRRWLRRRT